MNINKLVSNLENTIADKQWLVALIENSELRELIQINVDELKRILADVRVVQKQILQLEEELNDDAHA